MQWRQELLYVKRNEQGIIVAIQEEMPEGFKHEENEEMETGYRVIGD